MTRCRDCGNDFDERSMPQVNGRAAIRCRKCRNLKLAEYRRNGGRQRKRRASLLSAVRDFTVKSETLAIWLRTLRTGEPSR